MKVNISYAVELTEVPQEVDSLLGDCETNFRKCLGELEQMIGKDPLAIINGIETVRGMLSSLDQRLSDSATILSGYITLQNKLSLGENPPAVEGGESDIGI
tara:strand:+ start:634 stop:936 length:303 start_codon:yes stop_codon:yes gene_type:complete